ncbi:hypothetical protein E2320_000051 [Naja naja]|nr:hypothetical protein E2320_000051 [Naja naja]
MLPAGHQDVAQMISSRCKNLSLLYLQLQRIPSDALCNTQVLSAVGSTCRHLCELNISDCKAVVCRLLFHLAYARHGPSLARACRCFQLTVEPSGSPGLGPLCSGPSQPRSSASSSRAIAPVSIPSSPLDGACRPGWLQAHRSWKWRKLSCPFVLCAHLTKAIVLLDDGCLEPRLLHLAHPHRPDLGL